MRIHHVVASFCLALIAVWGQFIVYLVHEFEEHVYPGRFKEYFNTAIAIDAATSSVQSSTSILPPEVDPANGLPSPQFGSSQLLPEPMR